MDRLDKVLVARGLVQTRTQAQRLIDAGRVSAFVSGTWQVVRKPGQKISEDTELQAEPGEEERYASRGGLKLWGALERTGVSVADRVVLDVGQSTGGFTDCVLQAGAAKVVGVDVGRDQLNPALRQDPRVVCLEGINARDLPTEILLKEAPEGFERVVMDVSFISQTLILPGLPALMKPGAHLLSLVKPQFEVGRDGIGKGGIVRDERLYAEVEARICDLCGEVGLVVEAYFDSPIKGGDGNREFFVSAVRS
ncbi:TlyA family RNA methyltransferase [Marinimicrobium agarilyticum]|uniref:TlyA family RNA methyltransferase n=1 Tax=Marinimicrobium agarilyticum TaxID=306546 RepID=UPI00042783B8|nr:TlyA family RNA methyltransferase [Marinimicrobium agarilyticum]